MLEVIKDNTSLILNFQDLPSAHPYYSTYINITLETILASGIRQQAVSPVGLVTFPKLPSLRVSPNPGVSPFGHQSLSDPFWTLDLKCQPVPGSHAGGGLCRQAGGPRGWG